MLTVFALPRSQSARQRAAVRVKQRAAAKRDIEALETARAEDLRRESVLRQKARIKESRSAQISKIATRARTTEAEPVREGKG